MLELHEFFVEGGNQERSHVLLHITEPSAPEEADKGYFFALTEINNGTTEQIEHLQNMIDDLESGYYETDDKENKNAFEISLEFINKRGHHILENKNSIVNCAVGVIKKNRLSFACHGKPTIKLFYKRHNKMKVMDITDNENEYSDNQLFSAVIEGKINKGDYFYVSTPHVQDYIDDEQIKKALSERTTENAAKYIQKNLNNLRNNLSFGGIFCHIPNPNEIYEQENPISNKINEIPNTRQAQEDNKIPARLKMETNYRPRGAKTNEPFFTVMLITLGRAIVTGIIGLYKIIIKLAVLSWKISVSLILLVTNKGGQRAIVIQSINQWIAEKKQYIKKLPLLSKILFLCALSLAAVFIFSIGYLNFKEKRQAEQQAYENEVKSIIDKQNAAEASMIYQDDAKALSLLQEAADSIKKLNTDSKQRREKQKELSAQVEKSLMALRKLNITQTELITDLNRFGETVKTTKLSSIEDKLIAYGENDNYIYKIDPDTKEVTKKEHSNIHGIINASTPKEQDKIVFLTKNNGIAEYQKESGAVIHKKFDIAGSANISNIFVYNQRVYSVDKANNQILKHNKTQTGYDRGSVWIKNNENADLSDAISMAIDGDVFILKQNGEILKFTGGKKQKFKITGLDPKLNNPSELWTYNNIKNIYILEPANKRVVVLNKQGKLLKQYTANEWANPTGMAVNEKNSIAYILDSNKIYSFKLQN